jgi:hypothetical protein
MVRRGKHNLPTATRLLALVGAAVVAAGIALATGSASAQAPERSDDENTAKVDEGNGQNNRAGRNGGHDADHGSATPVSDEEKKKADEEKKKAEEEAKGKPNNGLDVLGRDCENSKLEKHDGFQKAPRCVETAFGEVSKADKNPSLLITEAPRRVKAGAKFTITVSTRNLVRDRFLGAAAGGYYLESSFLNGDGIQRGHFHTACRMLASTDVAPDPAPVPPVFVATQDGGGGARPDTVTVEIPGLPEKGIAQCATWAGDGSHRIPMMERANQTPAFDAVRITVN